MFTDAFCLAFKSTKLQFYFSFINLHHKIQWKLSSTGLLCLWIPGASFRALWWSLCHGLGCNPEPRCWPSMLTVPGFVSSIPVTSNEDNLESKLVFRPSGHPEPFISGTCNSQLQSELGIPKVNTIEWQCIINCSISNRLYSVQLRFSIFSFIFQSKWNVALSLPRSRSTRSNSPWYLGRAHHALEHYLRPGSS